jgi:AcrR family transcriptional regulator
VERSDDSVPVGRVERRRSRNRARLLEAAKELFAARGMQSTAVAEVAERADIATGSFYSYFRTKDELLDALLEEEFAAQLRLLELRQAQVKDPAEKVSVAHRHLVRVAQADPAWAWLLVRLDASQRIAWAVLGQAAQRDLQEGVASGRFHVSNERLALNASGGSLFAVMHSQLIEEASEHADCEHAEGVLRSFGIDRDEATEIARRPLPEPVIR